jgi:hypothetical protein
VKRASRSSAGSSKPKISSQQKKAPMSAPIQLPNRQYSQPVPVPAQQHIPPSNPLNFPAGSPMDFSSQVGMQHMAISAPVLDNRFTAMPAIIPASVPNVSNAVPLEFQHSGMYDDEDLDGESDNGMVVDSAGGANQPPPKRLQRKAELARESRKKKKMYIEELEEKVKQLESRVTELQAQHERSLGKRKSVSSLCDENDRAKHQKQLVQMLAELVSKPKMEEVELDLLKDHVQMFVETSREIQSQVEYNLDRVEDIISPSLQIKFTLWGLDQSDDFYDTPGLFTSLLCDELGLSVEQIAKLKAFRNKMHFHRQELKRAEEMLRDLREKSGAHLSRFNKEVDLLHGILSPVQLAKFYVWIEQNEWCMQMLNSMWTSS